MRKDASGEGGDQPGARSGSRSVLYRPAGEVHCGVLVVVQFDEVVGEGRPAVAAATVYLVDDDSGVLGLDHGRQ